MCYSLLVAFCMGTESGDTEGDFVASGERAGWKEGERAEPTPASWEMGERPPAGRNR